MASSATPAADAPAPKRRRVNDGSAASSPGYSSPDDDEGDNSDRRNSPSGKAHTRSLSIRRGRPPSRSRSRSGSQEGDKDEKRYYSSSQSRSRSPRSRSRSRSRSGSGSRSRTHSRSRTPSDSRSRSRSRSRSSSTSRRRDTPRGSSSRSPTPRRKGPARPNYRKRLQMRGHEKPISQVRISPDGRWIASASADGTARVWDAATGAHMDTLVGHMAGVSCLAWSPDSGTLATGSDDKAIRLWDRVTANPAHAVETGDAARGRVRRDGGATGRGGGGRRPLVGHHNYVYCLAFSPKGNILASGSYDEAVFLWDVRAGRLMRSLPAHSDPVSGIDFCRDGTLVASCSTDGLIRIWDTSTGQCLRTLVHEDNPAVTSVCFSPNGRFVLAFYLDSCIRMWDFVSMPSTVKKTYQGHANDGFSVGGGFGTLEDDESGQTSSFIASASEDGAVVLWDAKTKEVVQRIDGAHDGVCFWVDVHGDSMVSCGQDGRIVVYKHHGRKGDRPAVNGHSKANGGAYPANDPDEENGQENGLPEEMDISTDIE